MAGQTPSTDDELMRHRPWAITLAVENELWSWDMPILPFGMRITPATFTRCLNCYAERVSVGRFMDQSSLGSPRSLDSAILIDVEIEPTDEQNTQQDIQGEELHDAEMKSVEEHAAGVDIKQINDEPEEIDQYGEQDDSANGYLTVSSNKATQPPALCWSPLEHRGGGEGLP